jgi:hypothetical protein
MPELSENFNTMMKPKNCEAYPSFLLRKKRGIGFAIIKYIDKTSGLR